MGRERVLILGITNLFLIFALFVACQSSRNYHFSVRIEIKSEQWNP